MALLSQQGRAVASVRVKTYCEGYHLSKHSFNKLIHTYPSFKEYLESVARLRLAKNAKARGENTDDLQGMLQGASAKGQAQHSHSVAKSRSKTQRRASNLMRNLKICWFSC